MRFAIGLIILATLAAAPARAEVKFCTNGAVVFGDPIYKGGAKPNPTGTPLRDGPPIEWRTLTFTKDGVYTSTGDELWLGDLTAGKLRRIAGEHDAVHPPKLIAGPCATARLANVRGVTALADGSLIAADAGAHALVKITDPAGPACQVTYLVGTTAPVSVAERPAPGDSDGPGATAKVGTPSWPTADAAGNVYFVDESAFKVKKIAADEAHTVSTVAKLTGDETYGYPGMTLMGDKLYVISNTFTKAAIFEVDTKTGKLRNVLSPKAKFPQLDSSTSPSLSSIANDGKGLFVTGAGYIWKVSTAGAISYLAGTGNHLDVPKSYDPKAGHAAKDLLLVFRTGDLAPGSSTTLAWHQGALWFRGRFDGGAYIVKIACQ